MPRTVDHEARRAELAAAVWRVVERRGMSGASVRAVAAEAGVSPGSLRHFFSDQGELLLFAADRMAERVAERVQAHRAADLDGGARARRILEEMLPLDAERRVEATVWLECLLRARFDTKLSRLKAAGWLGERYLCRIAWAAARGLEQPSARDTTLPTAADERAVEVLHTFVDGLTLQAVSYPDELPLSAVRSLLDAFLVSLLAEAEGS